MNTKVLFNALKSPYTPNLLIYGDSNIGKKYSLFKILNQIYKPSETKDKNENDIYYSYNDTYYEFNMKNIENKNLTSFLKVINEIIVSKNYFGKTENKIIIFKNFQNIKYSLQNVLRVIIEKNRNTTIFIIITNKFSSIINPIVSRCLCLRLSGMTNKEKRRIVNQKIDSKVVTTSFYDSIYDLKNKNDISIAIDGKEIYDYGYQCPYRVLCLHILNIYKKKYTASTHKSLREIAYNMEKYNLSFSKLCYTLFSFIIKDSGIRDNTKYEIIKLLSQSDYDYVNSYRTLIVIESLLFELFRYYTEKIK